MGFRSAGVRKQNNGLKSNIKTEQDEDILTKELRNSTNILPSRTPQVQSLD